MQGQSGPLQTPNGEISSSLVRVVYHQLSLMGLSDPFVRPREKPEEKEKETWMVCTRRLFQLPIFVSVSSTIANAYQAVTVNPVTEKVVAALETPLKTADNAVCVSLDFLEERVPSVKLPPSQIYANIVHSFRSIFESTLGTLTTAFASLTGQLTHLMASIEDKPKDAVKS